MSIEIIHRAVLKGAKMYSNISGGKDGQVMTKMLLQNGFALSGLIHADLGKVEWPESLPQCQKLSATYSLPLYVVKRKDGLGLLEYWQRRMHKLQGKGIPFWSSSDSRYCTSDLKRGPINVFYTSTGFDFIISCEGIRADESTARKKKTPLTIRSNSSSFYKGMTVEQAIESYTPGKKLFITWYPVFHFSLADVWFSERMSAALLEQARSIYRLTGTVPAWWPFHPAYVYGNDRVSCRFCVLGSPKDLAVASEHSDDGLLDELLWMEEYSGFTFKNGWSLNELKKQTAAL